MRVFSGRSKPNGQKNAPKLKLDTGRVSKESDDPLKSHYVFDVLSEEGMEAGTTPASPRKGQIARLPIIFCTANLIFSLRLLLNKTSWKIQPFNGTVED